MSSWDEMGEDGLKLVSVEGIKVHFLDGSSEDIPVSATTTVKEIVESTCDNFGFPIPTDKPLLWGLFVSGQDTEDTVEVVGRTAAEMNRFTAAEEAMKALETAHAAASSILDSMRGETQIPSGVEAPFPEVPYALPWWVSMADIFDFMRKHNKFPRFEFKRRLLPDRLEPDKWHYFQVEKDVKSGTVMVQNPDTLASLLAMAMKYKYGSRFEGKLSVEQSLDAFIPKGKIDVDGDHRVNPSGASRESWVERITGKLANVPSEEVDIRKEFISLSKKQPGYGVNVFYTVHPISSETFIVGLDTESIHIYSTDLSTIIKSFPFCEVQRFGADAGAIWFLFDTMNLKEILGIRKKKKKKKRKHKSKSKNENFSELNKSPELGWKGIFWPGGTTNEERMVILLSLHPWSMHDILYDAVHLF